MVASGRVGDVCNVMRGEIAEGGGTVCDNAVP